MSQRRGRPRYPGPVTPAEERVLEFIRGGYTNAEIAIRLGVSVNTVRYHVSNLLAKAGLATRADLRNWQPPSEPPAPGRGALGRMALLLGAARWAGVAASVAGFGVLAVAVSSFRVDEAPASYVPAPTAAATPLPAVALVVGEITGTATGYEIVEPATQRVFELEPHPRLAAAAGQRAAVLGSLDGDRIATRRVEPLQDGHVFNCWGVVRRDGNAYLLEGGVCKGVELMPASPVQMLSFLSEKVNLPVAACSVTRGARLDAAPISLFGDPIRAAC